MKRLCVFCGSAKGSNQENSNRYIEQAIKVGELIAGQKIGLVYGGATIGVMGALANAVLEKGGDVIGVIPKSLIEHEIAHYKVTKLHIVEDMHERKRMMYDFSDAFLVLPGGMGTLDEMFEIITWSQLKLHSKPIYILNEFGFYDSLLEYIRHSHNEGFIKKEHLGLLQELKKAEDVLSIRF
ncbi:MAG: TIGR00730 family Rossman fold protein [Bdellovibrionota bacterium]|mgnify:CR=1 FL=1